MTIEPKITRVFVGKMARWPRDRQLDLCRQVVPDFDAIYEPHEFDQYVRALNRIPDEAALVARLIAIAEEDPKDRPGMAFVKRLMMLMCSKAVYIQDAQTGIKSIDGQPWIDLVLKTYSSITRGRELSSQIASEMSAKSHEAREPGLVSDWKDRKGSPEYDAVAAIWGNLDIKPAKHAISRVPDKELQGVHPSTMKRIFGTRRECLEYINSK